MFAVEPIAVIGCGAEKLPHAAPARDLYTGPIFRARLALAEAHGAHAIFVASALHGLIPITDIIEPYERSLASSSKPYRDAWTAQIVRSLRLVLHASPGPILALVSGPYAEWTRSFTDVHTVGDGLPVGKLRRALSEALATASM